MFRALHQLAQESPVLMIISVEGANLRVNVTQKKALSGAPLMLCVVATPEELEADFADALAPAAVGVSDLQPLKDQVREQLAAAPAKKPTQSGSAEKASNSAKGAVPKPATDKAPTKAERKQSCIDDYLKLAAGDAALTRETFIEKAPTQRAFEKLFSNWTKFKAVAERARAKIAAEAVETSGESSVGVDVQTMPLALDPAAPGKPAGTVEPDPNSEITGTVEQRTDDAHPGSAIAEEQEESPRAPVQTASVPTDWPFPTAPKDAELGQDKDDTSRGRDVYDEHGNYLSSITTRPAIGELVHLTSQPKPLEVVSIDGRRIMTKVHEPPVWTIELADGTPLFEGPQTRAPAAGQHIDHEGATYIVVATTPAANRCWVRPKLRDVVLDDGTVIGKETRDLNAGDVVVIHEVEHTVMSADSLRITVQPPAKVRNVVNDEGEKIGTWTENGTPLLEGCTIDIDGKSFTVLSFTGKAIFVEAFVASEVL